MVSFERKKELPPPKVVLVRTKKKARGRDKCAVQVRPRCPGLDQNMGVFTEKVVEEPRKKTHDTHSSKSKGQRRSDIPARTEVEL